MGCGKQKFSGGNQGKLNYILDDIEARQNDNISFLYLSHLEKANLSNLDLSNRNLSRVNFRKAYFSGANLTGSNLTDADMTLANLSGVIMDGPEISSIKSFHFTTIPERLIPWLSSHKDFAAALPTLKIVDN